MPTSKDQLDLFVNQIHDVKKGCSICGVNGGRLGKAGLILCEVCFQDYTVEQLTQISSKKTLERIAVALERIASTVR